MNSGTKKGMPSVVLKNSKDNRTLVAERTLMLPKTPDRPLKSTPPPGLRLGVYSVMLRTRRCTSGNSRSTSMLYSMMGSRPGHGPRPPRLFFTTTDCAIMLALAMRTPQSAHSNSSGSSSGEADAAMALERRARAPIWLSEQCTGNPRLLTRA
eukprot:scaffold827_cov369-Prasinococcus_capsulatus_cf.AAC.20